MLLFENSLGSEQPAGMLRRLFYVVKIAVCSFSAVLAPFVDDRCLRMLQVVLPEVDVALSCYYLQCLLTELWQRSLRTVYAQGCIVMD